MMSTELIKGVAVHGPWAVFALIMFFAYFRLVNDVIAITRKNTEAFTANEKAIEQVVQVMIEVKDTIHKCRKE